jgi:hypothetical protein
MAAIDPNKNPVGLDKRLESETDPARRRMLEEVRFHIAVEAAGNIEAALQRLAPQPEYVLYDHSTSPATISGIDSIRKHFYDALVARIDARLEWDIVLCMVDGRSVITEGKQKSAVRGTTLIASGIKADPAGFYLQHSRHLVVWPFDEKLRLIGETVYFGYSQPLAEVAEHPLQPEDFVPYSSPVLTPTALTPAVPSPA